MHTLTINNPDDWHVHFRDQEALIHTVKATANHFSRALVMPNLVPALTTTKSVLDYRARILACLDSSSDFVPYMTLYLNNDVTPEDLQRCKNHPYILGAKYYPSGATTNSLQGAPSILSLYPLFDLMQEADLVLQVHGEARCGDIFLRETLFIRKALAPLMKNFPKLRIVMEHISTKAAVDFVKDAPDTLAATITPHHLFYNRNDMLAGGIKPHYYCLPILKQKRDQKALQLAAVSGHSKFFAGTDSAPHAKAHKESACGCAGIFSAPYAIAIYAQIFNQLNKLDNLNAFLSQNGANFYKLPPNDERIELVAHPQTVPNTLPFGQDIVIPIAAGQRLEWSVHK